MTKQILSQHFGVQNAIAGVEGFGRNAICSLLGFTSDFGADLDGFTWKLYAVELVQQRNMQQVREQTLIAVFCVWQEWKNRRLTINLTETSPKSNRKIAPF